MSLSADSNRTRIGHIVEANWGVTPVAPLQIDRKTGESLSYDKSSVTSREIRSDRQIADSSVVNFQAGGGFNIELSADAYDDYIESAMFSTWSDVIADYVVDTLSAAAADNSINDSAAAMPAVIPGQYIRISGFTTAGNNGVAKVVSKTAGKIVVSGLTLADEVAGDSVTIKSSQYIKNGVTQKSFTIEKAFLDRNKFHVFRGMVVNDFDLSVDSGSIITGSFGFVGKNAVQVGATVGDGAPLPAATKSVLNAASNVSAIRESGVLAGFIKSLKFKLANNIRVKPAVGVVGAFDLGVGECNVTGSISTYFTDGVLYDKFIADTESSLSFEATDIDGNVYIFTFPRVKYTKGKTDASAANQDVMSDLDYQALADAVTGCTVQIDKF